jgi:protein O-GlcNAc transferase
MSRRSPSYPTEVHCNLGNALQTLGRCQQAMAHYARALAVRPDFAKVHNNVGNLLHRSGCPEQAMGHYRRALAIAPDYAAAHANLASALVALNRSAEAIVGAG